MPLNIEISPAAVDFKVVDAGRLIVPEAVVLPRMQLCGFSGYPLVRWLPELAGRLEAGCGPMLDRSLLAMWESWPGEDPASGPPASPLTICGFVATGARWGRAFAVARELRGFGATVVVTERNPTVWSLTAADVAGVSVVRATPEGSEVLVSGTRRSASPPRSVVMRYWEERLFASALAAGVVTVRPIPVRP